MDAFKQNTNMMGTLMSTKIQTFKIFGAQKLGVKQLTKYFRYIYKYLIFLETL